MEARVEGTHRPLGFGEAFARQLRLLWSTRRPPLLGVALLALLVLSGEPWSENPLTRLLLTNWVVVVLVGPIWAFGVFHNEGPGQRLYHWSLPVGRTAHVWARLLAGLAWLWLTLALLVGAGWIMAALDGDLWQLGEISVAGWLNFFTGPTLGYLGVSVLTVASDYPIRWFLGLLFAVPLAMSVLDGWFDLEGLTRTLVRPLVATDWGLVFVLFGAIGEDVERLKGVLFDLEGYRPLVVDYWWIATPLWILFFGGLVALAASRHPDTLPRVRRS
jgi:hypothetical protein